jgi:hypothetical protein
MHNCLGSSDYGSRNTFLHSIRKTTNNESVATVAIVIVGRAAEISQAAGIANTACPMECNVAITELMKRYRAALTAAGTG